MPLQKHPDLKFPVRTGDHTDTIKMGSFVCLYIPNQGWALPGCRYTTSHGEALQIAILCADVMDARVAAPRALPLTMEQELELIEFKAVAQRRLDAPRDPETLQ